MDLQNPWNWDFDYPDGEGYYQFYTKATDIAGNEETGTTGEASCGYDVTPPVADAGSRHDVLKGARERIGRYPAVINGYSDSYDDNGNLIYDAPKERDDQGSVIYNDDGTPKYKPSALSTTTSIGSF